MRPRLGRVCDDAPDQAARRGRGAVAHPDGLVFGAMRAKLGVGDLHRSARGVAQAIDGERLAALEFKPGLQRKQDQQRHDIGGCEVMGCVQR
jgi:hypothetical protein